MQDRRCLTSYYHTGGVHMCICVYTSMWDCKYLTSFFFFFVTTLFCGLCKLTNGQHTLNVVPWATTDSQSDLKGPQDLKKSNPNQQGTRALFRIVSLLISWEKAFRHKKPRRTSANHASAWDGRPVPTHLLRWSCHSLHILGRL